MRATLAALDVALDAPARAGGPDPLQLVSYLGLSGLVIALVLGGGLLLHRLVRGGWRLRAATRSLRVVDLLPLGGKRQLAVVQVYDRTLVLGLGEGGVRLLCEWDADGPLPSGPAPAAAPAVARAVAPSPRSAKARAVLAALGHAPAAVREPAPSDDAFGALLEAALERVGERPTAAPRSRASADEIVPTAPPARRQAQRPRPTKAAPEPNARQVAAAPARAARADASARRHPTVEELLGSEGVLG